LEADWSCRDLKDDQSPSGIAVARFCISQFFNTQLVQS
jgi:hypothetical protein